LKMYQRKNILIPLVELLISSVDDGDWIKSRKQVEKWFLNKLSMISYQVT
jgi:hypothetical protein